MAALVVVPYPGLTQGIEIRHDFLVALADVMVFARAEMPDFRACACANVDIGECVEGSTNIFEIGIPRDVQLRNVTRFEADALERGEVGDDGARQVCTMETFDSFKAGESTEIESVGDGIIRRSPIT